MRNIPNLGKALGILFMADCAEDFMHADVSAFGAPSECHELVARGEARRRRQARRHAEAIARAPYRVIMRQAKCRGLDCRREVQAQSRVYANNFPF